MNPQPPPEEFSELATRRLERSPEARAEARDELLARLNRSPTPGEIPMACERLRTARIRSSKPAAWFAGFIFLIAAVVAGFQAKALYQELGFLLSLNQFPLAARHAETLAEGLTEEERLQVFSRSRNPQSNMAAMEALRRAAPDDPVIYWDYAWVYHEAHSTFPPDFRETWQRIEPDNGAWLLLEAGQAASRPGAAPLPPSPTLELLEQAADAKNFEIHSAEMRSRRLAPLKPAETLMREVLIIRHSLEGTHNVFSNQVDAFSKLITSETQKAAGEKDVEAVRHLMHLWERLTLGLGKESTNLLEAVTALGFSRCGEDLKQAAFDLGMTEEEARIDRALAIGLEVGPVFRAADPRKGSSLAIKMFGVGILPDDPADSAISVPGLRAEHAAANRFAATGAALILLVILAGIAIEILRRGGRLRLLGDGLAPLLRGSDAAWWVGLGILAPLLWCGFWIYLTPLGRRDMAVLAFQVPTVPLQAWAALLLLLCALVLAIRWRIQRRLGFLNIRVDMPWVGLTVLIVAAMLVPAIGAAYGVKGKALYLKALAGASGIPALWLLWQAGLVLLAPRAGALGDTLLCRKLFAPLLGIAVLLISLWPALKATERGWLQQDQLTRSDRTGGSFTRGEGRSARWIADKIQQAFGAWK